VEILNSATTITIILLRDNNTAINFRRTAGGGWMHLRAGGCGTGGRKAAAQQMVQLPMDKGYDDNNTPV